MIRVLIVDDHALIRRGLTDLLDATADIEVVGSVSVGEDAADAATTYEPDVVLMDLSMPGIDGVEATARVLAVRPETKIVMLTSFSEHERIRAALAAGAVGYLLKDTEPDDISTAIRDVANGGVPLSPRAARALLPENPRPAAGVEDSLTPREREVLALVATGLPNKSVATRLSISEKTVKAHLSRIFTVLGVTDRTSAALWAQRHGMV